MTINKFRGFLYKAAKYLGDVQAFNKAKKKKSMKPLFKRLMRRIVGRFFGKTMQRMFR